MTEYEYVKPVDELVLDGDVRTDINFAAQTRMNGRTNKVRIAKNMNDNGQRASGLFNSFVRTDAQRQIFDAVVCSIDEILLQLRLMIRCRELKIISIRLERLDTIQTQQQHRSNKNSHHQNSKNRNDNNDGNKQRKNTAGTSAHTSTNTDDDKSDTSSSNNNNGRSKHKETCTYCGTTHKPRDCPAYGKSCHTCNRRNHFSSVCRTVACISLNDDSRSEDSEFDVFKIK